MIAATSQTASRSDQIQTLLQRARWLDAADQALLDAVLSRGIPTRTLAEASEVSSRTIQRRVARLVGRLNDPTVLAVVCHHSQWPAQAAAVAKAVVVRGRTLRAAAAELGLTLHEVRQLMQQVNALVAMQQRRLPQ